MSTRYVWEKCEKEFRYASVGADSYDFYAGLKPDIIGYCANNIIKEANGTVSLSGGIVPYDQYNTDQVNALTYPYFAQKQSGNTEYAHCFISKPIAQGNYPVWKQVGGGANRKMVIRWSNGETAGDVEVYTQKSSQGAFISNVSGDSKSTYPEDGSQGDNWYVYKGSNSIDPLSITYSSSRPERGERVTVMLNPRANALGGTVSYLYQCSIDGGRTWATAGEATTETEKEITVPSNAERFTVRVRAQDDIGFTSTDYVTGSTVEVQTMKLWVGVDNKARPGRKLWVGIDGKARPVAAAWVGDENGKARKWF